MSHQQASMRIISYESGTASSIGETRRELVSSDVVRRVE